VFFVAALLLLEDAGWQDISPLRNKHSTSLAVLLKIGFRLAWISIPIILICLAPGRTTMMALDKRRQGWKPPLAAHAHFSGSSATLAPP